MNKTKEAPYAQSRQLLSFINSAPTPFHAVSALVQLLKPRGFVELKEGEAWSLKKGGRYYVIRNGASIAAFTIGMRTPEETGFHIIGAHTDSPNLRLKPNPEYQKSGYVQLGVEVYGGALLASWTDRDLSLAGRVVHRSSDGIREGLLRFDRPMLRIPQLAIHLNREVNDKGLLLNRQLHLPPIFTQSEGKASPSSTLKQMLAEKLECGPDDIVGLDLALYDTQPGSLGGAQEEFIFSPRLDNLASCHAATMALVESPEEVETSRIVICYDHEEVGSGSAQGAVSPFLRDLLERSMQTPGREAFLRALSRSFCISADMAHAVHPNYSDQHDSQHLPQLNKGPVIKWNSNQKYATDGKTCAQFDALCQKAGVPLQKFAIRSDLMCGSTIGPITASTLGIPTVDVGSPMLSMHSIREMSGSLDHEYVTRAFREYFSR
ncbi:MAG: M18 family aminopeptidase [Candidatus Nitrohelix vancouverensis]|uniref:M18 family aminopeptidase n=1 Tax=Candidatus Nitrohelix vancouverensis TaxID=2705534 RepID=A0A7T0C4R3_9BACT|nr:MAG: M18 family aminopeptidase [Candidatus Nitrohelix vancouverensis]